MAAKNTTAEIYSKRISRCGGCSVPLTEHDWGIPSKFCDGEEKISPSKHLTSGYQHAASPQPNRGMKDIDTRISDLEEELAVLDLEEERQAKQRKVVSLQ